MCWEASRTSSPIRSWPGRRWSSCTRSFESLHPRRGTGAAVRPSSRTAQARENARDLQELRLPDREARGDEARQGGPAVGGCPGAVAPQVRRPSADAAQSLFLFDCSVNVLLDFFRLVVRKRQRPLFHAWTSTPRDLDRNVYLGQRTGVAWHRACVPAAAFGLVWRWLLTFATRRPKAINPASVPIGHEIEGQP